MCVVSGVYDYWGKQTWPFEFPAGPAPKENWITVPQSPPPALTTEELAELRQMIKDFKQSVSAAKTVDKLTGQPDCADPEKQKLEEKVKFLEAQIKELVNAGKAKRTARRKRRSKTKP